MSAEGEGPTSWLGTKPYIFSHRPKGEPRIETVGDLVLCSWPEECTSSLGVAAWMRDHGIEPGTKEDLEGLRKQGYPKANPLVALAGDDPDVPILTNAYGDPRITHSQRTGSSFEPHRDPCWDWDGMWLFVGRRV